MGTSLRRDNARAMPQDKVEIVRDFLEASGSHGRVRRYSQEYLANHVRGMRDGGDGGSERRSVVAAGSP
jgi:hypothetical protein